MEPIKCPKCGKINDGTTDFCIYCGTIYEEYKADEDNSNIFSIGNGPNRKPWNDSNPLSGENHNYRLMIIIGYIFAILGSVLGFIFAIYLITRKDPSAKKHGIIQLALLIIEFAFVGFLIYTGQMDINMILDPFNTTQMYNMTKMYNSSQNITAANNFSSLFGF